MNKLKELAGKLITGSAATLVDSVTNAIDKTTLSKEEKEQFKKDFLIEANRHEEALIDKANKELELNLADTANARELNARIQESEKSSWWAKNTAYFLDIFLGLIWGTITIFLLAKALKLADNLTADLTAVLSIYSTVTALFMVSLNYHRGSSVGSAAKQKQLDKIMEKSN